MDGDSYLLSNPLCLYRDIVQLAKISFLSLVFVCLIWRTFLIRLVTLQNVVWVNFHFVHDQFNYFYSSLGHTLMSLCILQRPFTPDAFSFVNLNIICAIWELLRYPQDTVATSTLLPNASKCGVWCSLNYFESALLLMTAGTDNGRSIIWLYPVMFEVPQYTFVWQISVFSCSCCPLSPDFKASMPCFERKLLIEMGTSFEESQISTKCPPCLFCKSAFRRLLI